MVKFCRNCGAEIPAEGKFCGVCGTPAAVQPEAEAEQIPVVVEEQVIPAISMDDEPAEIVVEPAQTEIEPMEAVDPEPVVLPQDETPVIAPVDKKEKVEKVKEPEAPKEKPPVGKGILNRRGAFRGILAVLLCIVIFVGSFAALSLWNVGCCITGFSVDADMVESILEDNQEMIEDLAGVKLSSKDISEMADQIGESMKDGSFGLENLEELAPEAAQSAKIVVGVIVGIYLMVVLVFVLIVIILCTILGAINRSTLRTCRDIGVTLMVAGGIWGIVGLFPMVLPDLWGDLISDKIAAEILGGMLENTLLSTAVVFGTGFVLVLIKAIGKPIARAVAKRAKKS